MLASNPQLSDDEPSTPMISNRVFAYEMSRSRLPDAFQDIHARLQLLALHKWRRCTPYSQDYDWVFASQQMQDRQPF
jgi:hypothetical protein